MPRSKDPELIHRDRIIVLKLREGKPRSEVCAEYGITQQRLSQIIAETAPQMPEENARAWIALQYEGMLERAEELSRSRGRPMFNGKGEHSIDAVTQQYAYDESTATQALEVRNRILNSAARLWGAERPPSKPNEVIPDFTEYAQKFSAIMAENSQLKDMIINLQSVITENQQLKARLAAIEGSHPADVVE